MTIPYHRETKGRVWTLAQMIIWSYDVCKEKSDCRRYVFPTPCMYGIFAYILLICMVNVGKYTSPMHPMGSRHQTSLCPLQELSEVNLWCLASFFYDNLLASRVKELAYKAFISKKNNISQEAVEVSCSIGLGDVISPTIHGNIRVLPSVTMIP